MRGVITTMATVLILLGVVGCGGSDPEPGSSETADAASTKADCGALGMTASGTKSGRCKLKGKTYDVVDRDGTIPLGDQDVRLKSVLTTKIVKTPSGYADPPTKADGTFVILKFGVKNRAHTPYELIELQIGTTLQIGENVYSPTENGSAAYYTALQRDKKARQTLQPETNGDTYLAFDVPSNAADKASSAGTAITLRRIVDDQGVSVVAPESPLGLIRTWR